MIQFHYVIIICVDPRTIIMYLQLKMLKNGKNIKAYWIYKRFCKNSKPSDATYCLDTVDDSWELLDVEVGDKIRSVDWKLTLSDGLEQNKIWVKLQLQIIKWKVESLL